MKNKSKTKILYIGPIPPEIGGQSAGGIATHAWQLATQAYKRGYDVYILANTSSSFTKDGVKVLNPPKKNKLLKAFYGFNFWLTINKSELNKLNFLSFKEKVSVIYNAYLLKIILNSINPDLVHIHSLYNIITLSFNIIPSPTPLIITNNEFYYKNIGEKKKDIAIANCGLSIANYIICVSKYAKNQLEKSGLNYHGKLKVINIPIDSSKIPLLEKKEIKKKIGLAGKKIILFIGVFKPIEKKGLDILLKAFCISPYLLKKCKLIVISNAEGVKYTKFFIEKKSIDVLALQNKSWTEIVDYYNASDIFVMPSRSEGFGIVYTEALLANTPVIGFHKIINELENIFGIYIGEKFDANKEDEKDLAKKIIKVLNMNFKRGLLRRKVIETLSWDVKFQEFDSVYREVLEK